MASTRLPGKPLRRHRRPADDPARAGPRARGRYRPGRGRLRRDGDRRRRARRWRHRGADRPETCPSGTDRMHAALAALDPQGRHDVVVNLQGDLPTMPPALLARRLRPAGRPGRRHRHAGRADRQTAAETRAPQVVKAACAFDRGRRRVAPALYFSRAPIPCGDGPRWHHIGIYAYRRAALARFVGLPASPLERREKLEQLRALEAGMRIACAARRPRAVRRRHARGPRTRPRGAGSTHPMSIIAFQGVARRLFRPRLPRRLSRHGPPCPAPPSRRRWPRVRDGPRRAGHAALREQPGRPGAGHPPPAAGIRPVRRRRAFPAGRALPAGPAPARRWTSIRRAHSHPWRSARCATSCASCKLTAVMEADTAGAAELVAERGGRRTRPSPPRSPPRSTGSRSCARNVEDAAHNTTRFYVMARERQDAAAPTRPT